MIKLIKHSRIVKDSILNAMDKVNENTFDRYIVFNIGVASKVAFGLEELHEFVHVKLWTRERLRIYVRSVKHD